MKSPAARTSPTIRNHSRCTNLNTCHVWDEEGEQVQAIRAGRATEVPVWITKRFAKLGRDLSTWQRFED